jgi:hypothetical protein
MPCDPSGSQSATEAQTLSLHVAFGTTASISMSIGRSSDSDGTVVAGEVSIDGVVVTTLPAGGGFSFSLGLGIHTVRVIVEDNLGAQSDPAEATIIVLAPPTASFVMTSGGSSAIDGQTLALSVVSGGNASITFLDRSHAKCAGGNHRIVVVVNKWSIPLVP